MIEVIGQGLAGTVAAWQLWREGIDFRIGDVVRADTASKVAAGLVTPITGGRLAAGARFQEMWELMLPFYREIERVLEVALFEERAVVRILSDANELELWRHRREWPSHLPFLEQENVQLSPDVRDPWGNFAMKPSGLLRVGRFLTESRAFFQRTGRWLEEPTGEWSRQNPVIFCEGPWGRANPNFEWVPLSYSHGDVLRVGVPDLAEEERILNWRQWLIPDGDGIFRTGSTYLSVKGPKTVPDPNGRLRLETGLRNRLRCDFEVLDHVAAVRPIAPRRRALMGEHPGKRGMWFFNGLGSRGVLTAPHDAARLIAAMLRGEALEAGTDIRENL